MDALWARWRWCDRYRLADTAASCAIGVGSALAAVSTGGLLWSVGQLLWTYRWFDVGTGYGGWIIAFCAADFVYYWGHRLSHSCRWYWAAHVSHHSSCLFNFSTALRQPWTPTLLNVHLLAAPLVLLGIRPELIAAVNGLGLIYQFFLHTETVGQLGVLEWVLNTPSHHRVHHGCNDRYIDRNFGGVLIVWDRLFGTFTAEDEAEPAQFGMRPDVGSYNPLWLVAHEYVAIAHDMWRARSGIEALRCLLRSPSIDDASDA